ncbi:16S rRNA (guanine(966)-N(2))-methyltransferase RsmD [Oceanobacillus chungangensis]|uniref:16S rRNA (Guanine(966)-N(2))-methyltransferase RsmD n=1 Tax=Oceanobacillus chungangensis TaxID=1229152 RepID=A0A3D8PQH1_9BACI|nr:16S rRNA (guanine(966)-N(2))-methyltransferase RsmD [Oceanobacillus chungangensis]RDW17942.1 16S rRNA (guanine(966)-N(2))-methyltransferase RsmD [Oceanobacillus chungangensis]
MRVIAGEFKGRQLKAVPGKSTRPTTDKVKEAVFQVMGPFFEGGAVLDLFAGSGSLGIEAISRGMDSGIFVDKNPKAIHTISDNVKTVKIEDKVELFRTDAVRALKAIAKRDLQFDLILLDPPYKKVEYDKVLKQIIESNLIKKNGIIYCEHDLEDELAASYGPLSLIKHENYGGTIGITIYQRN